MHKKPPLANSQQEYLIKNLNILKTDQPASDSQNPEEKNEMKKVSLIDNINMRN